MIGLLALQKSSNRRYVKRFYALAPAVFVSHARAPLIHFLSDIGSHIRKVFGDREFGKIDPIIQKILINMCQSSEIL